MIICVLLPYFATSLELRDKPALDEPLVISSPKTGYVYAASPKATELGIAPRMTMRQAQALCPDAYIIPAETTYYQSVRNQLLGVLGEFADRIELGEAGQATALWLDAGALTTKSLSGLAKDVGRAIREEVGLPAAIGTAAGKFPAYVTATTTKLNRIKQIAPGKTAAFLAPLPVTLLPLEPDMAERLFLLGIHTMGQLAALPASAMLNQFGTVGRLMHRLAGGTDPRPITRYEAQARESMNRQFESPVADKGILNNVLASMAQSLTMRLQAQGQICRDVWLYAHLDDQTIATKQTVLPAPTADEARLTRTLTDLRTLLDIHTGVEEISVILTDLLPALGANTGWKQLGLFDHQTGQLDRTIQNLIPRYGAATFPNIIPLNDAARRLESRFYLSDRDAA